jgi:hypothetical protein
MDEKQEIDPVFKGTKFDKSSHVDIRMFWLWYLSISCNDISYDRNVYIKPMTFI